MYKLTTTSIEEMINDCNNIIELEKKFHNELHFPACITLLKDEVGVVFAGYHHHDFYEILYISEGKIEYAIDDKKFILKEGDVVLITPSTLHQLCRVINEPSKRIILKFGQNHVHKLSTTNSNLLEVFDLVDNGFSPKITFQEGFRRKIEQYLETMNKLFLSNNYGDDLLYNQCFIKVMLIINKEYLNLTGEDSQIQTYENNIVSQTIQYITNNIENKITIKDISEHLLLSESRLSHIFKEETGTSILQFIIKKRLILAKELLRNNHRLNLIALKCGFQDYTSFFRSFKKEYGITPKTYADEFNKLTKEI